MFVDGRHRDREQNGDENGSKTGHRISQARVKLSVKVRADRSEPDGRMGFRFQVSGFRFPPVVAVRKDLGVLAVKELLPRRLPDCLENRLG